MRINVQFMALLISVKSNTAKNGNVYYRLSIESDSGDAGTVGCSQEIYDLFNKGDLERFQTYQFEAIYNTQYGSLIVNSVIE